MRKILCILMGIIMTCLLAACGGKQNEQKSSPKDGSKENTVLKEESEEDAGFVPKQQPEGTESYASKYPYDSVFPQHEPYGEGIGAMPRCVVWNYDMDSVLWDGDGYWWKPENFDEFVIQSMVNDSIASLGGKKTAGKVWNALFQAHNAARGKGSVSYASGEKITIKANINGSGVFDDDTSDETQMSYTNPVLLKALLVSLVGEAGISPEDITIYDVSRLFPDYMAEMCTEGILEHKCELKQKMPKKYGLKEN